MNKITLLKKDHLLTVLTITLTTKLLIHIKVAAIHQ
jgi:hypothetical protein